MLHFSQINRTLIFEKGISCISIFKADASAFFVILEAAIAITPLFLQDQKQKSETDPFSQISLAFSDEARIIVLVVDITARNRADYSLMFLLYYRFVFFSMFIKYFVLDNCAQVSKIKTFSEVCDKV